MKLFVRIITAISIVGVSLVSISGKAIASYTSCSYEHSFGDNFSASSLDTKKWNTQYPSGNSGEQQYYSSDAVSIKEGILNLTAEKRSMQGYPYTSGIINTQGLFSQQYGYFVIRAKLPEGKGLWPAFWLLPAKPNYPLEIDIFEMLGKDPHTIYMSNHWLDGNQKHQNYIVPYQGPNFSSSFHTFSLLWTPEILIWYVDGVEQYRMSNGIPNEPMFLLVNLAVGGQWPGNPDNTTYFPSSMQIDYIDVYQVQCHSGLSGIVNQMGIYLHDKIYGVETPGQYHSQ